MSETVVAPNPTQTASQTPADQAAPASQVVLTEGAAAAPVVPAGPVVPEKYEFAAPQIDGKPLEVDPAALGSFETAAREVGLTQEQFAKIAPLGAQLVAQKVSEAVATATKAYEHLSPAAQDGWVAEIKADPKIGGDRLGASLADAAKAIDAYGGAELRQALELTRAGNHPAIVRAFVALGKAMNEPGGLLTGRPAAGSKPANAEEAARNFYNNAGGSYPPVGA